MSTPAPKSLVLEAFHGHVRARPDAIYLTQPVGGGQVVDYTWARVSDEARRMAAHLQSLGYPPGSRIAIVSKNCAHFIIAELGIWMAGYVTVALFPTLAADTVAQILEHSGSKLIFVGKLDDGVEVEKEIPAAMPKVAFPLAGAASKAAATVQWDDAIANVKPLPGEPVRPPKDLSMIIYTSGSTGKPKGVMHDFAGSSAAGWAFVDIVGIGTADRLFSYLPLAHTFERSVIELVSLLGGARVFFAESLDTFVADIRRARPTLFASVPRLWLKFQQGVLRKMPQKKLSLFLRIPILSGIVKKKILDGLGFDQVKVAASGSAPISPELIQWYRDLGLELLEGYGMTENSSCSHITRRGRVRVGYVGEPNPGCECKLSPEGEILIKSPGTMVGYFLEPELTAEAFTPDGFLRTGDRGEIDEQGRLRITGRVKELFKTAKGKYVAPVPIENLLNADTHIELSCVAGSGYPDAHAIVQLAEGLVAKMGSAEGRAELEHALETLLESVNKRVENYEQLAFIAVVKDRWAIENGFLTPTLKVKRAQIEHVYKASLDTWYAARKKVIWH